MINKYLYNDSKQKSFGTNGFTMALFLVSNAQWKAWDCSKKWTEIFSPFFREEKEMNQRYEYRLLNHMLMNNFTAILIIIILVSEAHLSF